MAVKPKSVWAPILPVPEDAPAVRTRHNERGDPLRTFIYRDADEQLLGYTCRFHTSTGDAIHLPLTWCNDQDGLRAWRWIQFPRLRPLYGLEHLAGLDESDNVLLVFDEHSAEYARKLIPWLTPVSWPGGVRKIDEVDWSPLRGRSVWIWPTLTRAHAKQRRDDSVGEGPLLRRERQPGWQAALKLEKILTGYGGQAVFITDPWADDTRPDGWDAGMAGTQNWTPEQTEAWFMGHLSKGLGAEVQQRIRCLKGEPEFDAEALKVAGLVSPPASAEPISTPTGAGAGGDAKDVWVPDLVYKSGELSACLSNVFQILSHRPEWAGVVALDEFALKIMKRKPPPYAGGVVGEWTETDDARTAMLLQRQYGFTPSSSLVREAVGVLADDCRIHPPREYLAWLKWDGMPRLELWAVDYLGVPDRPYVRLASKWWLMGAVVRILRPGAKFDSVLVLTGKQGKKKSSALEAFAPDWFSDADLDFNNKDSMIALQGKLIFEIPELGALARSDIFRQKAFLSRRFDEYRPPYGRGFVKQPRQMIFAGSTNEWEWNKDPTGGRRFWPIECIEINVEGIIANRDQLFAEALHYVNEGERYWPSEEEQRTLFDPEQLKVEQQDVLFDKIDEWVGARVSPFTLLEVATDACDIKDITKITRDIQTRLGQILRKLGCTKHEHGKGKGRFKYKPPQEEAKSETSPSKSISEGVANVGF